MRGSLAHPFLSEDGEGVMVAIMNKELISNIDSSLILTVFGTLPALNILVSYAVLLQQTRNKSKLNLANTTLPPTLWEAKTEAMVG